jgi:mannose-6-phosphate isomerase-like protein (cupin superfamily)
MDKVNLSEEFAKLHEPWRPRLIGVVNGMQVKLVKLRGAYEWHRHEDTDEFFLCVNGRFKIEYRDHSVELTPGELIVVPRGFEHRSNAAAEADVLLFEPAGTKRSTATSETAR